RVCRWMVNDLIDIGTNVANGCNQRPRLGDTAPVDFAKNGFLTFLAGLRNDFTKGADDHAAAHEGFPAIRAVIANHIARDDEDAAFDRAYNRYVGAANTKDRLISRHVDMDFAALLHLNAHKFREPQV